LHEIVSVGVTLRVFSRYLSGQREGRNADGGGQGQTAFETHMARTKRMHLPSEASVVTAVWRLQAFRSR
jgi:hypothetical protein